LRAGAKSIVFEDVRYDKVRYIGITEAYERFCIKPTECTFFSFLRVFSHNRFCESASLWHQKRENAQKRRYNARIMEIWYTLMAADCRDFIPYTIIERVRTILHHTLERIKQSRHKHSLHVGWRNQGIDCLIRKNRTSTSSMNYTILLEFHFIHNNLHNSFLHIFNFTFKVRKLQRQI